MAMNCVSFTIIQKFLAENGSQRWRSELATKFNSFNLKQKQIAIHFLFNSTNFYHSRRDISDLNWNFFYFLMVSTSIAFCRQQKFLLLNQGFLLILISQNYYVQLSSFNSQLSIVLYHQSKFDYLKSWHKCIALNYLYQTVNDCYKFISFCCGHEIVNQRCKAYLTAIPSRYYITCKQKEYQHGFQCEGSYSIRILVKETTTLQTTFTNTTRRICTENMRFPHHMRQNVYKMYII